MAAGSGVATHVVIEANIDDATGELLGSCIDALLAEVQWRRASDEKIARTMRVIAQDETRHAALAWDVAAWIEPLLTPEQRAMVIDARHRAATDLRSSFAADFSSEVQELAGMPSAREAHALIDAVAGDLWAA